MIARAGLAETTRNHMRSIVDFTTWRTLVKHTAAIYAKNTLPHGPSCSAKIG